MDLNNEVTSLVSIILLSFGLGIFIFFASSRLAPSSPTQEKTAAYECGFEPFEDARSKFDVRFYLVALLFIIFDLEVSFLFPVIDLNLNIESLLVLFFFLIILTLGFIYEWFQGALSWS